MTLLAHAYSAENINFLFQGLWVTIKVSLISIILSFIFGLIFGLLNQMEVANFL